jgi:long-chain acyl-CoA synthetase
MTEIERSSYYAMFQAVIDQLPNEPAIVTEDQVLTYSQLGKIIAGRASDLKKTVRSTDLVTIGAQGLLEPLLTLLAVFRLGAVPLLLRDQIQSGESSHPLGPVTTNVHLSADGNESIRFSREHWPALDSIALLFLTSGTTGSPKIVAHTSRSLIAGLGTTLAVQSEAIRSGPIDSDRLCDLRLGLRFLSFVSPSYMSGFTVLQRALMVGECVVLSPSSGVEDLLRIAKDQRVTNLMLSPFLAQQVSHTSRGDNQRPNSLLAIGIGGGPTPESTVKSVEETLQAPAIVGYGLTETAGPIVMGRVGDGIDIRAKTTGRALPGVRLSLNRKAGPSAGRGRLIVQSPSLFIGYWDDELHEVVPADRHYDTGDMASIRTDGYVTVEGRIDGVILRGGLRIDPHEIEDCLLRHPEVEAARVYGRPSRVEGETDIYAVVSLRPDADLAPNVLRAWCQKQLGSAKVPRLEFAAPAAAGDIGTSLGKHDRDDSGQP